MYAAGNLIGDPFGLSADNWRKLAAGATIIVGLGVASAFTGGVASVILGGAFIGSLAGGATGAVLGYIDDGVDGLADEFLTGAVVGGISGAVASSRFPAWAVTSINTVIDAGEYAMDNILDGNEITWNGMLNAMAMGFVLDNFNFNEDFTFKAGALNPNGDLYYDWKQFEKIIQKETRRANHEYSAKKMARATSNFSDDLYEYLTKLGIDISFGDVKEWLAKKGIKQAQTRKK